MAHAHGVHLGTCKPREWDISVVSETTARQRDAGMNDEKRRKDVPHMQKPISSQADRNGRGPRKKKKRKKKKRERKLGMERCVGRWIGESIFLRWRKEAGRCSARKTAIWRAADNAENELEHKNRGDSSRAPIMVMFVRQAARKNGR